MNTDVCLSTAVSGKRDVNCTLVRTADGRPVALTHDSIHCNISKGILYKYARKMLQAAVAEDEMTFHLN